MRILLDMETRPRLMDRRGNAILVSSSIYQACTFYELFCQAGFKGKCAIVTSYQPQPCDVSKENAGDGLTEKLRQYDIYRQMLADHFNELPDKAMYKVEQFEQGVKERFIKHPGQMRLLIVVDKLLTGCDAPPATYLYIDKTMDDHGLFQAICRVNRVDGDDRDYGYIVDYSDLFNSLQSAITDHTGGALDGYEKHDIEGLLSDRLEKAKADLDEALETIRAICEPVAPPRRHGPIPAVLLFGRIRERRATEGQRAEAGRTVQGRGRRRAPLRQHRERHGSRRVHPRRSCRHQAGGGPLRLSPG
jgi:type I restriction enzyme R subunit